MSIDNCKITRIYWFYMLVMIKAIMYERRKEKSVTVNDLERRNGRYFALSLKSVVSGANYVSV